MTQDSVFNQQVRCRWEELRGSILDFNYLDSLIDSTALLLNESQAWNFTVWPIMGSYVWPNYYIGQNYQEEVDTLKWWLHNRILWLDNNIQGSASNCNLTGVPTNTNNPQYTSGYPNPFTDQINFSMFLPAAGEINVSVFNAAGQEVIQPFSVAGTQGTNRINVPLSADLSSGIYVMTVQCNGRSWTQTLIKN
jgi:hypothetical protein